MTATSEPRTWTLEIRPPAPFLNLNDRRERRSNAPRPWRAAGWAAAKQAKLPTGLARVRIDVVVWLPPNSDPDEENLRATTKALVDGLGRPHIQKPNPAKNFKGLRLPATG
ncbi:hypothetical protein [Phytohabitans houttuyneae]|uniref:Uncharacterized protein n=1 Tax=Phytohabitans houttuyneae TaxID=1076126 RepID=A0A6V8KCX2_9ACTN|nr:hypothetical protein [Phytohabitans houttuyneae]GFJ79537.1 hypothetical protein Phou_037170 [Phytohabitans houttuyneae]